MVKVEIFFRAANGAFPLIALPNIYLHGGRNNPMVGNLSCAMPWLFFDGTKMKFENLSLAGLQVGSVDQLEVAFVAPDVLPNFLIDPNQLRFFPDSRAIVERGLKKFPILSPSASGVSNG